MKTTTTIIEPSGKWQLIDFGELWRYRELIGTFVVRDIKLKYKQTFIGVSWAILQPLMTMVIFSFFFGKLAKMPSDGVPYPIFSYSGLLLWTYFSGSLSLATNSLVSNAHLVTKVYFPRIIIPISATLTGLVDYVISMVIMIGLMVYFGIAFTPIILVLPLVLLMTWLLSTGFGLILASVNVTYRDVRYVIPFFLQLLLYITPVIYPASVADRFRLILNLNPMTGLIETHRAVWLNQAIPWNSLNLSILLTLLFLILGLTYFNYTEKKFADVV